MTVTVTTRAALKTLYPGSPTIPDGTLVQVQGWYAANDGFGCLFQYQVALAVTTDPDGAPIVVDTPGRKWKAIAFQNYRKRLSASKGDTLKAVGDSIGVGNAASNYTLLGFIPLHAAEFGFFPQNDCVSGKGVFTALIQAYTKYQPFGIRTPTVFMNTASHNDLMFSNTKTPTMLDGLDRAYLTTVWAGIDVPVMDASWSKTGSWVAGETTYGDKSSNAFSTTILKTSTSGDKISGTVPGNVTFIRCFNGDGTTGNRVGSFDVKVGGVVVDSYDGDGKGGSSIIDPTAITPHCLVIPNLTPGDALEIVSTGGAGPLRIDTIGALRDPEDCEPVEMWIASRPDAAHYGSYSSVTAFDAGDVARINVVNEFIGMGYPAYIVRTNDFLNPSNLSADGEHPNDAGHRDMSRAGCVALKRGDQITGHWTPTPSGWTFTGAGVSFSGDYVRDGKTVEFWITGSSILSGGVWGTWSTTKNTSTFDCPPGLYVSATSIVEFYDTLGTNGISPFPSGMINPGNSTIYLPTVSATSDWFVLHGRYKL